MLLTLGGTRIHQILWMAGRTNSCKCQNMSKPPETTQYIAPGQWEMEEYPPQSLTARA